MKKVLVLTAFALLVLTNPAQATHLVTGKDDRGRPKTDNKMLVLQSPMVPNPVHYRYAWARSPLGNLQADRNSDVPFATQRSDNWPLENVPLMGSDDTTEKLDRRQRRMVQEALRKLDVDRRLYEAEVLRNAQGKTE